MDATLRTGMERLPLRTVVESLKRALGTRDTSDRPRWRAFSLSGVIISDTSEKIHLRAEERDGIKPTETEIWNKLAEGVLRVRPSTMSGLWDLLQRRLLGYSK
jgi:hypothetical protein